MHIAYDRVQRTEMPSDLRIELDQSAVQSGKVNLFVSESIVRELGAQRIVPQPESTRKSTSLPPQNHRIKPITPMHPGKCPQHAIPHRRTQFHVTPQ